MGGKKLLNFMDDFNMPCKDTFGSQPPLELIRHWIDYGFWYDRLKQSVKQIKVIKLRSVPKTASSIAIKLIACTCTVCNAQWYMQFASQRIAVFNDFLQNSL